MTFFVAMLLCDQPISGQHFYQKLQLHYSINSACCYVTFFVAMLQCNQPISVAMLQCDLHISDY